MASIGEFHGSAQDPPLDLTLRSAGTSEPAAVLRLTNRDPQNPLTVTLDDLAYGTARQMVNLKPARFHGDHAGSGEKFRLVRLPDSCRRRRRNSNAAMRATSKPGGKVPAIRRWRDKESKMN